MLRTTSPARRNPAKKFVSAFAMAIALAGGAVVANAGFAPVAIAQDYSDAFSEAYQPVADVVNAEGGDIASVSAQFPTIVSLIETPDDSYAAGNLILIAGNKATNAAWQRQGLELQLASGKVAPETAAQYWWFVGNLAYNMDDFNEARAALQAAVDAGWTEQDPTGLLAETYYQQEDAAGGIAFVQGRARAVAAAGGTVPEQWLLRGLAVAYDNDMLPQAVDLGEMLVTNHTSQLNWLKALQVINAMHDLDDQAQLDLLRLMRLTDTLTDRTEYIRYIESADPRIMSNEAVDVLAEGLAADQFEVGGNYYEAVKTIVNERMAVDLREASATAAEGRSDPDGDIALGAGDVMYSLDDFATAEELYALAITKGGADVPTALTRQGMAQVRQGKFAEAQATLAQVTGPRSIVARMWAAYAEVSAR